MMQPNILLELSQLCAMRFAGEGTGTSDGAGFLIDKKKRGWILTNAHVSGYGTGDIEVSFKDHDFYVAKPVYIDKELDISVVEVLTNNIPDDASEAKLDCGDRPLNGVAVAAFGHPHGLTYLSQSWYHFKGTLLPRCRLGSD